MRRKDRETTREIALEIADKCQFASLSMTDTTGLPYCVPISTVRDGDVIYFHCASEGKKLDCLRNNSRVCLVFVGDVSLVKDGFTVKYESAIISGPARELKGNEEKRLALRLISERFCPENMQFFEKALERSLAVTSVWQVDIEEISGKKHD